MVLIVQFFLITQIIFAISEPIDEGGDVGLVHVQENGNINVINTGRFPYMVHLDIQSEEIQEKPKRVVFEVHSLCGGSLIRENIVLSAAHCLNNPKSIEKITAWVGVLDTKLEEGKGQKITVQGFTIHKDYVPSKGLFRFMNDITILFLVKPAKLNDFVKLANLPAKDFVAAEKRGWIIGWGTQSCGTKKSMLQRAVTRGVSAEDCYEYYKPIMIPKNFICTLSDDKNKTSTHGDSGGPFIVEGLVVGVSSFGATDREKSDEKKGIRACDAKVPAVYTYVPKYLDWIDKTLEVGPKTVITNALRLPPRGASLPPPQVPPRISGGKNGKRQQKPSQLSSSTRNKKRDSSKRTKSV